MSASDELRRALARLGERERAALQQQSTEAGEKWAGTLPGMAEVWRTFGALVADVDRMERTRAAGLAQSGAAGHTMRPAGRARA